MKAIDNFNTELGVRFSTYAVPMIIGELRRYLRDNSAMRVSAQPARHGVPRSAGQEAFIREHQREPDIVELAKLMDVPKERSCSRSTRYSTSVAVRAGVPRRHGHGLRDGIRSSDTKTRDDNWLAGDCSAGRYAQPERPRAPYHPAAVLRGTHRWKWHAKYTFRQTKGRKIPVLFLAI